VPAPVAFRRSGSRAPLAAACLTLALAACSSTAPAPTTSPTPPQGGDPSSGPSAQPSVAPNPGLLIEITSEGGFINPAATIAALPLVVVDTDGRIYTPSPALDPSAGPLVPGVEVRDVGAAGAARILAAIRMAGLDQPGNGGIAAPDAGYTVFTVEVDGMSIVSRFGLGGGPGVPGLPGGPSASGTGDPGAAAFQLLASLTDPSSTWGAPSAESEPYQPVGFRVFDAPSAQAGPTAGGSSVPWPLAADLASFGIPAQPDFGVDGLRSGVATGDAATALAPVLASATAQTTFVSGGRAYTLWVRPLFPDELGG
jgi:hypothetical protein